MIFPVDADCTGRSPIVELYRCIERAVFGKAGFQISCLTCDSLWELRMNYILGFSINYLPLFVSF